MLTKIKTAVAIYRSEYGLLFVVLTIIKTPVAIYRSAYGLLFVVLTIIKMTVANFIGLPMRRRM